MTAIFDSRHSQTSDSITTICVVWHRKHGLICHCNFVAITTKSWDWRPVLSTSGFWAAILAISGGYYTCSSWLNHLVALPRQVTKAFPLTPIGLYNSYNGLRNGSNNRSLWVIAKLEHIRILRILFFEEYVRILTYSILAYVAYVNTNKEWRCYDHASPRMADRAQVNNVIFWGNVIQVLENRIRVSYAYSIFLRICT